MTNPPDLRVVAPTAQPTKPTRTLTRDQATALTALVVAFRPDWEPAGVHAQCARSVRDGIVGAAFAQRFVRAAADPRHDTPAAVWFTSSTEPVGHGCPDHLTAGIRTDGSCAACWADRHGSDEPYQPTGRKPTGGAARCREVLAAVRQEGDRG